MKRFLIPLLAGLNVLLGLGLAWLWFDASGELRGVTWQAPAPRKIDFLAMVPDLPPPTSADVSQFLGILERPIFALTRRPPPPPAPPPPPPPPDPLADLQIYGLVSAGKVSGILAKIEGRTRTVRVDEAVGPWTLKTIKDREVVFANGAQTRAFPLRSARLTGPVPAAESATTGASVGPAVPSAVSAPANIPQFSFGGSTPERRKP